MTSRTTSSVAPVPTSALDALLAAEQEIAQRLADADRDGAEILRVARADAAATSIAAADVLALELAAIAARSSADIARAVGDIRRDALQAVARYHALTPAEVTALGADVAARSTGLGALP